MNAHVALPADVERMVHQVVDQESIIAITDKRGLIAYANDRFCEISGFRREELVGANHRILKSGKHAPDFYKELWRTILQGRTWKGNICNRAKDGHLYWVETVIVPLRVDGLITHFIALRSDVTAQMELETALAQQKEREENERRLIALGQLADGVLHDLNNILTGMLGLISEANTEQRNALLQRSIAQMVKLTRMLRDYSSGRTPEKSRFRLCPLLACACSLASFRKGVPRTIRFLQNYQGLEAIEVESVEAQVFEVLMNLVVNATEACASRQEPEIALTVQLQGERVFVRVEDNGPGVAKELAGELFKTSATSKGPGRGLGLRNARQVALELGGDLVLERLGGPEAGACFRFEVPLAPSLGPLAKDLGKSPPPYLLVSEDDPAVRRLIEQVAEKAQLKVTYPETSLHLYKTAKTLGDRLAAVVIDSCDEFSQQGVLSQLKRLNPLLPVVLISAHQFPLLKVESAWQAVYRLPKPFATHELMALIGQVLETQPPLPEPEKKQRSP